MFSKLSTDEAESVMKDFYIAKQLRSEFDSTDDLLKFLAGMTCQTLLINNLDAEPFLDSIRTVTDEFYKLNNGFNE